MSKKEWFASWFDTPYYHSLYQKRDLDEAKLFIRNLVGNLELKKDSRILDLACGKGRHAITLHEMGYNVLGVDLSENSIKEAKKNCKERLEFRVHDMREILTGESFDAVVNLFTSFGYFEDMADNESVVRSVNSMLKPGGIFVIDFMNAAKVIAQLTSDEEKICDGILFRIRRSYDGSFIRKEIKFNAAGEDFEYHECVQALRLDDFKDLLLPNGFEILRTFGNFDLHPFDEKTSDRLILITRKTK